MTIVVRKRMTIQIIIFDYTNILNVTVYYAPTDKHFFRKYSAKNIFRDTLQKHLNEVLDHYDAK